MRRRTARRRLEIARHRAAAPRRRSHLARPRKVSGAAPAARGLAVIDHLAHGDDVGGGARLHLGLAAAPAAAATPPAADAADAVAEHARARCSLARGRRGGAAHEEACRAPPQSLQREGCEGARQGPAGGGGAAPPASAAAARERAPPAARGRRIAVTDGDGGGEPLAHGARAPAAGRAGIDTGGRAEEAARGGRSTAAPLPAAAR